MSDLKSESAEKQSKRAKESGGGIPKESYEAGFQSMADRILPADQAQKVKQEAMSAEGQVKKRFIR